MTARIDSQYGEIGIDNDVISKVVGIATTGNYGVVGMVSKNQIKDGIQNILGFDNYSKGVVINHDDDKIIVEVYVTVEFGTKISEICRNVQRSVKYDLQRYLGIQANVVNVYVQGIRVTDE
ncbi:MAG: Asp23/Gls24 family envelope stress response protein [Aerococcus sp.]|nr:Asp23/Gls24 family envelope stress response protein [Aerococcus sp.]